MDSTIADLTRKGWEIVYRDDEGTQMRKRKQWPRVELVLFVVLPLLLAWGGVALLFGPIWGALLSPWFLSFTVGGVVFQIIKYLMRRDELQYLPRV